MSIFISHTTVDCRDAYALSEWWKSVLGYSDPEGDPNGPGDEECIIRDPDTGHELHFAQVPEVKPGKNRIHFDVRPRSNSRDEELKSLLAAGATTVVDHRGIYGPGSGWVTLADPEGNVFDLLRSEAEVASQRH